MTEDLAFRFDLSAGKVSQTVITWMQLFLSRIMPFDCMAFKK